MLAALCAAIPARADHEAGDLQLLVTAGSVRGHGSNEDVDIGRFRLGLGDYFRDGLGFYGNLSFIRPTGERDGRTVDTAGLTLVLALRWHFLRWSRYGLYTEWGMGAAFTQDAFPPEGTPVNGTPQFGLGLTARLRNQLHLSAGLRELHMSNGQGIVPENPSFDGFGAYAGLEFKAGSKTPWPPERHPVPFRAGGFRARLDAVIDDSEDETAAGGIVSLDSRLFRAARLRAQVSLGLADVAGDDRWDMGVLLYRETRRLRVALGYGRQEVDVFASNHYRMQIDRIVNDIATLTIRASLEDKNLDDDLVRGRIFMTVHTLESLAFRSGFGIERPADDIFESGETLSDAGFAFGLEWSPPLVDRIGMSVFFDLGIASEIRVLGVRVQPGPERSLRERHRAGMLIAGR